MAKASSQWLSPSIAHIDGNDIYAECETCTGERISCGDFIYLLPADPSVDLYIARIENLYEDRNSRQKFLYVRWFYRTKDLQHQPPTTPVVNEVYHTNYFDCQLVETVVGHCKIVRKGDQQIRFVSTIKRVDKETDNDIYVCRYSYSAEKGSFTIIPNDFDAPYLQFNFSHCCDFTYEDTALAKNMAEVLINVEKIFPIELASSNWPDRRLAWVLKAKNAMTSKDVKQILVELEDGLQILKYQGANPKQISAWRKNVSEISTRQLSKYVSSFNQKILQKTNEFWTKGLAYESQCQDKSKKRKGQFHDQGSMKRQVNESQTKNVVQDNQPLHEDIANADQGSIKPGNFYKIDHTNLPSRSPAHLKSISTVLVTETTRLYVNIKFPSISSLRRFFGKDYLIPVNTALEETMTNCLVNDQPSEVIGQEPELDEQFVMKTRIAEKVLIRLIPCTEYLEQRHIESFWILEGSYTSGKPHLEPISRGANYQFSLDIHENDANSEPDFPSTQLSNPCHKTYRKGLRFNVKHGDKRPSEDVYKTDKEALYGVAQDLTDMEEAPAAEILAEMQNACDVLTTEVNHDPDTREIPGPTSEGPFRWGTRKKITFHSRCRGQDDGTNAKGRGQILTLTSKPSKSTLEKGKPSILKLPKDMQGRWSSERYKAAQLKLLDIMHEREATPGKPILRPTLREEARKHIGDTGLLDHLLKHMTDTVVSNGERFRRRHNSEGAMEYWLEDATLMELRKQAGVDDPYWMPPPGWKPGDPVATNAYYGYVPGMSVVEAEEMKRLREDVEKLKSEMHTLALQMRRSLVASKRKVNLQHSNTTSWRTFEEDIRKQTEAMRKEILDLQKLFQPIQASMFHTSQEEKLERESQKNEDVLKVERHMESELNSSERGKSVKLAHHNIGERLCKIECDIGKLYEEATSKYKSLTAEKISIEIQLVDLWRAVAAMQEDISSVLNSGSNAFAQGKAASCTYTPLLPSSGVGSESEASGAAINDCSPTEPHNAVSDMDMLFFKKAAEFLLDTNSLKNGTRILGIAGENANVSADLNTKSGESRKLEEQNQRGGFRLCKPQGSFLWPSMAKPSSSTGNLMQIEDVLSSIQSSTTPFMDLKVMDCSGPILVCSSRCDTIRNSHSPRKIEEASTSVHCDSEQHDQQRERSEERNDNSSADLLSSARDSKTEVPISCTAPLALPASRGAQHPDRSETLSNAQVCGIMPPPRNLSVFHDVSMIRQSHFYSNTEPSSQLGNSSHSRSASHGLNSSIEMLQSRRSKDTSSSECAPSENQDQMVSGHVCSAAVPESTVQEIHSLRAQPADSLDIEENCPVTPNLGEQERSQKFIKMIPSPPTPSFVENLEKYPDRKDSYFNMTKHFFHLNAAKSMACGCQAAETTSDKKSTVSWEIANDCPWLGLAPPESCKANAALLS